MRRPTLYGTAQTPTTDETPSSYCGMRLRIERRSFLALLAFFGFANIYAMRANLSVAIVQMTTDTETIVNGTKKTVEAEFRDWNSVTQGTILGAFFYGYVLTQMIGGIWAHRSGGKMVFFIGIFGTAAFTVVTPPLAILGKFAFIGARFMEGLLEGVTYPAMHVMWSNWAPALERTRLATFAFSGSYFGTVLAMPLSAIIGDHFGWSFVFYFFGVIALLWCVVWTKCVYEFPQEDPMISTDELTLLQKDAVGHGVVPWKKMLLSKPVWAVVWAHFCENWGFYTMLTALPRILSDLASYKLEKAWKPSCTSVICVMFQAGFVSALPYLLMGTVLLMSGQFADYLRKMRHWETVAYAGHLMGVSNTVATLPGMISPIIVGFVVSDGSEQQWHVIFYLTAIVYFLGAVLYGLFGSGEKEEWADEHRPFAQEMD
ncbi:hypothetical protein QR680_001706 [Steinernema hermaphroditum]|uniref:Major facilitator superfamily (MFS) profile domain-containing protein n=1 Tax=Steinernema hermaphroditum TaxID=289476 RepID=A0AA39H2A5_9BILA|nr:hypothetical protein QR680_001706 [Steinernema hermaphroditum]